MLKPSKSIGFKKLHQRQRGYVRKDVKVSVKGLIKRVKKIDKPKQPKPRGRPTREEEQSKFGWAGVNPFKLQGPKIRPTTMPFKIVDLIRNPIKAPIPSKQPLSPEAIALARQKGQEARFIAGKAAESEEYLKRGALMPSSVVEELIYDPDTKKAFVQLGDNKYTYHQINESVFDRWFQGKASCITTDVGKFTGSRRKRWIAGKTPSLGAFYNKYIKGQYVQTPGWA